MSAQKSRYATANFNDEESVDEESTSQEKYVLTIPRVIYDVVSSENTWCIAVTALFLVTAVAMLGFFLDDQPLDTSIYYESYDGRDNMIYIPSTLFPLEDISREEILYEQQSPDEEERISKNTMAFFLHIPRSGGTTFLDFAGPCFELTQASDLMTRIDNKNHNNDNVLEVINSEKGTYANVNTFTIDGLIHAKELDMIQNVNLDIISTPLFYETLDILFSSSTAASTSSSGMVLEQQQQQDGTSFIQQDQPKLRMITLIRDPLERLNSYYHYIIKAKDDENYNENLSNIALLDYLQLPNDRIEFNYVTKTLVNKLPITTNNDKDDMFVADLTQEDLIVAKQILFQKCIVGLLDQKTETISRWKKLFQWKFHDSEKCDGNAFINWEYDDTADSSTHMDLPSEDSKEYNLLLERNSMDVELYEYAKVLFNEQGALF